MPTIFVFSKFKVIIYPQDHNPPHVHILGAGCEAKINIENLDCYYCKGFSDKDIRRITKFISERIDDIWEAWNEYKD